MQVAGGSLEIKLMLLERLLTLVSAAVIVLAKMSFCELLLRGLRVVILTHL